MSGLRDEITKRLLRPLRSGLITGAPKTANTSDETSVPTDSREGRQIGFYRVLRRLGSGGMGDVYLAIHTRLGRHTALKFLPEELLSNPEMLHHLEQEARTASALNHPNILTIHEICESAGELVIASEFVQGITLKKAMARGLIDPDMALRVATQIASALTAAHSAGVIHRDLKPANVMVRPDGYVKVIDFGLAKMTDESSLAGARQQGPWSQPGSVVGTVDYMSPEQASGEEVDPRSDLWSLGVLLYEMLGGQRPFSGETDSHVIVAILDTPAPPLPNLASLPRGVGAILQRALMKDPAKRYQSAQEMLADLERIDTSSVRRRALLSPRPQASRRYLFGFAGLAVVCVAAAWWWGLGGKERFLEPDWFHIASVRQLTFNGRTQCSAISPDGKYLAFAVGDAGGMESLHLKQVDQSSDEVRISRRNIHYLGLTFSPDSRTIYEVEQDDESKRGKLFTLPLVGDRSPAPLVDDIDGPVTFSPSGDRFAFVRWQQPAAGGASDIRSIIKIMPANGGEQTEFFSSTRFALLSHLAWSPGGDRIAAILLDHGAASDQMSVQLLRLDGHLASAHPTSWSGIGQLSWASRGSSLILTASSRSEGKSRSQVREFALSSKTVRDITTDLSGYNSVSMTDDGNRIAVVKMDPRASLWVSAENDIAHGQSSISELQDKPSLAWIDGGHLLVSSHRTGYPNLAVFRTTDQSESILTNDPSMEQHAEPITGGHSVVYSSNRAGGFHLWRFDRRSNRYTQLTFGSAYDDNPVVSPDGKWIVYTSQASNFPLLYRIPVAGGTPLLLTKYSATDPQISPDGKWIACRIQQERDRWSVAVIPSTGGDVSRPVAGISNPFSWAGDGKALISAVTDAKGVSNLWRVPLDGSPARLLTQFEDQTILKFAWSPDGKRLACIRLQNYSDVMLLQRQDAR